MDETIGVKGGHNDRLRSLRISKKRKKKLQEYEDEYTKELEKKVKKQQRYTLIKTIPIVVSGTIIKNIFDVRENNKDEQHSYIEQGDTDEQEKRNKASNDFRDRKIITLTNGEKVVIYIPKKEEKTPTEKGQSKENIKPVPVTFPTIENPFLFIPSTKRDELINDKILEEIESDIKFRDVDFNKLDDESKSKLSKLRSRRITDYYENKLKEIRYDLRKLIYDYNVLASGEGEIVYSKEAEELLDKLTELISRIEALKKKLDIENLDMYDDNYIYVLIEEYINDFRDKKIIKEIKDSPLYILISDKLDELEAKRDSYSKRVEKKQDELAEREVDFEKLKQKYYSIDKINNDLQTIQEEQEKILINLRERVANSVSEFERVTYEMKAMNKATARMVRFMMFQMFLPGPKYAKALATSTAAYLHFLKNVYDPSFIEKKYRVIQVADYSREIENSISTINDASKLLGKTSTQIDKMLREITDKYKDYIGVIPECDSIISSLKRIKLDISEKEEEMKRLKKEQEKILENNNAKVLKRGTYPVK